MCCESKGESGENASTFRFDEQTWYVDESGAEMCFTIEAPDSWSLRIDYESEDRNWMSVTPEKGAEGVTEVTFKVERADRSNGERIARVVAVCRDAVRMKKIVQKKMPAQELSFFQLNLWQECKNVPGAFEALVDQIVALKPDFATFCELYKSGNGATMLRLIDTLKQIGLVYYQKTVDGRALLSKYVIEEASRINTFMFKGVCRVGERRVVIYPAHAQYIYYSCYYPRGYNDGGGDSGWSKMPDGPKTDVAEILSRNELSGRPESVRQMIADARSEIENGALVFFAGDLNEPSHLDWQENTKNLWDHNGCVVAWQSSNALYAAGFVDAYREKYPDPITCPGFTWPADNKDVPIESLAWAATADERDRIDFVYYYPHEALSLQDVKLVGPKGTILRSQRVEEDTMDPILLPAGERWPSDHKGLFVTFRLGRD